MGQFILVPIIFFGLIILVSSFFVVKQQTAAIIERFGKFHSIRQSGLHLKIPIVWPNFTNPSKFIFIVHSKFIYFASASY